jgi:beta-lactamase class A
MIRPFLFASLLTVAASWGSHPTEPGETLPPAVVRASGDTSPGSLEAAIRRAAAASGGRVGVAAVHVETGRRVSLRGAEAFPMASVFKLPIATELLTRVQAGRVRLADSVDVRVADLRPGHSPIADHHPNGYPATVDELLAAMVIESDNTAADVLLRLVGGPGAVTARMRALGIRGIRIDRSEGEIARDFTGLPPRAWTGSLEDFRREEESVSSEARGAAYGRFMDDPRDTSTPDEMARLLVMLYRGEALGGAATAHLLNLMARTATGPHRLRAGLPAGAVLAHKTGSCGSRGARSSCVNDVGLVTLPGGAGHAAIAVFVRGARSDAAAERAIAAVARAVYGAWSAPR